MDQPYSRIADALLDYQYWAPNDPQTNPYDDTGWTFPKASACRPCASPIQGARRADDAREGRRRGRTAALPGPRTIFAINYNADNAFLTLRYKLKDADIQMCRRAVRSRGHEVRARNVHREGRRRGGRSTRPRRPLGLKAVGARRGADGQDAPRACGARRAAAQLAEHADRGLVAAGVRRQRPAVRLPRAGRHLQDGRSAREVRRHHRRARA